MSEWFEKHPLFGVSLVALIGFLGFVLIRHLGEIFSLFFQGLGACFTIFGTVAGTLFSLVAGSVGGTAASVMLISSVAIPITVVGVYKIILKAEDKPKAMIVAVGLFLNPLFIDFFKDSIHGEHPIQKLLIGAFGAVTFLIASLLWSDTSSYRSKTKTKAQIKLAKITAILLFLLPTLCMAGYIAVQGYREGFAEVRTPGNVISVIGLIVTAFVGIGLSRYFDAP